MGDERNEPPTKGAAHDSDEATRAESRPGSARPTRPLAPGGPDRRERDRFPNHDRYEFREIIGRGGQGVVFRVFDAELDRDVALKTLLPGDNDVELAALFVEEARATARLTHPNIIPLFDVGKLADGRPFYTMQYVTGRSLRDVLQGSAEGDATGEEWSLTRLVQVLLQVCNALELAHGRKVLHRDVKPANIMLGPFGEVLLVDWGIAKAAGAQSFGGSGGRLFPDLVPRETEFGMIKGTLAYMAPEALRAEQLSPRSDIYAVGVILHEILTGELPHDAETTDELIRCVLEDPLPAPEDRSPERHVPAELSRLVMRALAKDPGDRHPTVGALGRELQAYLDDKADREKRLVAAAALREEARAALDLHEEAVRETERLAAEMVDLVEAHPPWQALDEKAPLIEARERAEELLRARWTTFVDAANRYTDALAHVPDERNVRKELTDLFWPRFLDAEHHGRELEALTYRKLVERFHDGRLDVQLTGDGSLELSVSPQHAELTLHPQVQSGIALVDGPGEPLGRGDVVLERLPMGSYIIVATAAGHHSARYPLCIERGTKWAGELALPEEGSIPAAFVFVPGMTIWQGGDPQARNARELQEAAVSSFAMRRHLVTFGEYCEFLSAMAAEGPVDEFLPRIAAIEDPLCTPTEEGGFESLTQLDATPQLASHGPDAKERVPVCGVDLACAMGFAAWESGRDGRRYRLPTGAEWELAARGADRRIYPWGNRWDDAACHSQRCFRQEPDQAPISLFLTDAGPHGVRGLAGELGEWTTTPTDAEAQLVQLRGGAWNLAEGAARCAGFAQSNRDQRLTSVGFRLVLEI